MIRKTIDERIEELGRELRIPEEYLILANAYNWVEVFKTAGARTWDERHRVHDMGRDKNIRELRNLPMIAPGGNIAMISQGLNGQWYIIAQVRNNGEKKEEDKEIGLPGGAIQMWGYTPEDGYKEIVVLEHPEITAWREWEEETGKVLDPDYDLELLTIKRTTNHYDKWPDAYALSFYYIVDVEWSYMNKMRKSKGSEEGKIIVIKVKELPKYKWFPDASEVFQFLLDHYG